MARRKTPRTTQAARESNEGIRKYRVRGVQVEIRDAPARPVELKLDGVPIDVEVVDGKFHSQTAHMFVAFDTMDALVDTLLANEGRTWTLARRGGPPGGAGGHPHGGGNGGHPHGGGGDGGGGGHHHAPQPESRGAGARSTTRRRSRGGSR